MRLAEFFSAGVMLIALTSARADDSAIATPCSLDPGPVHTVSRVIDGETLALDDGSVVRLIGTLAPRARDAAVQSGTWPEENAAIRALSDLVAGKRVKLAYGGRRSDRYGHLLAHVFLEDGGAWVQGALLDGGHARVYGLPQNFACAAELLAHEDAARRQRAGLWSNSIYRTLPATKPEWLLTLRGRYERIIGAVVSVGHTKSSTYLNFGSSYKTDFTARIGKSVIAANPTFATGLDALKGKTIVIRGWIERNNGPLVDIEDPSQIQPVDPRDDGLAANSGAQSDPDAPVEAAPPTSSDSQKKLRPAPAEGPAPGGLNL